jgi:endonuclease/exonuclease/phosphatase family metal-dependent hydrolase
MKFKLYMLFLMIAIGSSAIEKSKPHCNLKIMSYNIHDGEGMDGIIDLERIAGIINASAPDVVALQEVDILTRRSGYVNQLEKLAGLCNMHFAFGNAMDYDEGAYGNAILSKHPIIVQTTFSLPGEPRSALAATLKIRDDFKLVFISLHLDVEFEFRKKSVNPLLEIVNHYDETPLILAGDLNSTPDSEEISTLMNVMENATKHILTFPASTPEKQLDYILFSPKFKWKVGSSMALEEKVASDHRLVLSVLKLNPCNQPKELN